jgi:hypothetical protein
MSRSTHARSVAESIRNDWEGGCQSSLPKGPKIKVPQNGVFSKDNLAGQMIERR